MFQESIKYTELHNVELMTVVTYYQCIYLKFSISSVVTFLCLSYQQSLALKYNIEEDIHSCTACIKAVETERICVTIVNLAKHNS